MIQCYRSEPVNATPSPCVTIERYKYYIDHFENLAAAGGESDCALDCGNEKAPNLAVYRPVFPGKYSETVLKFVMEVVSLLF